MPETGFGVIYTTGHGHKWPLTLEGASKPAIYPTMRKAYAAADQYRLNFTTTWIWSYEVLPIGKLEGKLIGYALEGRLAESIND